MGDQFRISFSKIGNLRSIVPSTVNIMALTATATHETYQSVLSKLAMTDPVLVSIPPERGNITYYVHPPTSVDELSGMLNSELREMCEFPKTIVFVRKYKDCSDLYDMLEHKLGIEITNPCGYPNVSQFRRVEMFSRVLTTEKKEQVLSAFSDPNGVLQVVIATSAFGLGIDCQNIQRTIHWGLPSTIEEYVQESGRAGRDGQQAQAILYEGKVGKYPTMSIKNYLFNNDVCRRRLLFCNFLCHDDKKIVVTGCLCCDICAKLCLCEICAS